MDELVERCYQELDRQMEAQADDTTPSSIQRQRGLVWLEGWFDLAAIIPIVADWQRERDAGIALSKYDPRNRNGAREWDEWVWAAGQIAAAIRGAE